MKSSWTSGGMQPETGKILRSLSLPSACISFHVSLFCIYIYIFFCISLHTFQRYIISLKIDHKYFCYLFLSPQLFLFLNKNPGHQSSQIPMFCAKENLACRLHFQVPQQTSDEFSSETCSLLIICQWNWFMCYKGGFWELSYCVWEQVPNWGYRPTRL